MKRTGTAGEVAVIGQFETGKQRYFFLEDFSPDIEIKKINYPESAVNSVHHNAMCINILVSYATREPLYQGRFSAIPIFCALPSHGGRN
jgi:hypothetical protein